MGYTHYWYRPKQITQSRFDAIVADFNKVVIALDDMGVKLADGAGEGLPVITADEVVFNGLAECGHPANEAVVIPWPAPGASGVHQGEGVNGSWFAGATLDTRTCNGDCSYETFAFERQMQPDGFFRESEKHPGLFFNCTKTAYRPYDVAVTAFLIIAKHHLGAKLHVNSDGEDEQWYDAKRLCYIHLGYGPEYQITEAGLQKKPKAA